MRRRSLRYRVVEHVTPHMSAKRTYALSGQRLLEAVRQNPRHFHAPVPTDSMMRLPNVSSKRIGGTECLVFDPLRHRPERTVLMVPGGGYVFHAGKLHWAFSLDLARESRSRVVLADYPVTPKASSVDVLAALEPLYDELHDTDGRVVLAGDSAGAGLALSLGMIGRDKGRAPDGVFLVSPAVSMCFDSTPEQQARFFRIGEVDPVLSEESFPTISKWWAGDLDVRDWRVSPIYGDLSGLGGLVVFTGTYDVLNVGARMLRDTAREQGVPMTYVERVGMMHDWVMVHSKEGNRDRRKLAMLVRAK